MSNLDMLYKLAIKFRHGFSKKSNKGVSRSLSFLCEIPVMWSGKPMNRFLGFVCYLYPRLKPWATLSFIWIAFALSPRFWLGNLRNRWIGFLWWVSYFHPRLKPWATSPINRTAFPSTHGFNQDLSVVLRVRHLEPMVLTLHPYMNILLAHGFNRG